MAFYYYTHSGFKMGNIVMRFFIHTLALSELHHSKTYKKHQIDLPTVLYMQTCTRLRVYLHAFTAVCTSGCTNGCNSACTSACTDVQVNQPINFSLTVKFPKTALIFVFQPTVYMNNFQIKAISQKWLCCYYIQQTTCRYVYVAQFHSNVVSG